MYWECVKNIREHIKPYISIKCNLTDLETIHGNNKEPYNIGDRIGVRLPGRNDVIRCRVTKTTKNPRTPETDTIEIETFRPSFMANFFRDYFKSSGHIKL